MNKKTILAIALLALILVPVSNVGAVLTATNVNSNFPATTFMGVVQNIANFVIAFVTILGIIFLVWGGIQYVTAGGDEAQVEKAKNTIIYAVIGLFIAAVAFAIEDLVINQLLA